METLIQAVFVFLPAGYLVAATLNAMAFAGDAGPRIQRLRRPLLWTMLVLHAGLFVLHGVEAMGLPPLDAWLSVSMVSLALGSLFAFVTRRESQPTVGALVLGVVAALQMIASMFGPMKPVLTDRASDGVTFVHAVTASVASAAVILSGLYGFLYLLLLRQMRRQKFGAIFRQLPDLRLLAHATRSAALAGFAGLAIGVNVGIGLAHARGTLGFSYSDPTVLLTLGLWLHFGLIALSAKIRGLNAQRASLAAAIGLTVLVATLLLAAVPGATFHALN